MKTSHTIPGTHYNCHFSDHPEPHTEAAFNAFVNASPSASSMQQTAWADLVRLTWMQKFAYLWCEDENSGQIMMAGLARLTQWLPKRYFAVFHRGPVFRDTAHLDILLPGVKACLRRAGVSTMTVSPRWEDEAAVEVRDILAAHGFTRLESSDQSLHNATGLIDLTPSEEEIFSTFTRRCRKDLRATVRKGLVIRPASSEAEVRRFRKLYYQMAGQRNMHTAGQPDILNQWLSFARKREEGVFLVAEIDNQLLGGVVVVREGDRALPRTVASLPVPSVKVARTHGLLWEAMKYMKGRGCRLFDMGGVESGESNSGRQRRYFFKLAFNPRIVKLVPIHMAVLRPVSHKLIFGIRRAYRRFPIRAFLARFL